MATVSAKDLAKIEADKQAKIATQEQNKQKAYQTALRQAPEGYRNNPQFQAALKDVVYNNDAVVGGNKSVAIPLREKLNAIVTRLDPYPSSQKTSDPKLKQAYGNAYAQKLVNVEGEQLSKQATALNEASKAVGLPTDFAQNLEYDILGQPNTSGGGMGFFSSITKPFANAVKGVGSALGVEAITDPIANVITNPTLKNFTSTIPFARGLDEGIKQVGDGLKIAGLVATGGALAGAGGAGAAGAGAAGAGAGAGGTLLGSSTLGSLAGSLGLEGLVNAAPSVLSSLGLSGAGTAAGTAASGASPYFVGGAIPYTGGALSASAPTLLGSSTLAGLANSLGLGGLVEAAPNVLGSRGLSGGSTALGSGVLNNLLGGGGQAGAGGLGSLGGLLGGGGGAGGSSLLQDLLFGGGTLASGIYGADTAKDAAKLQAEAVDKALGSIQTGYNTGRADLQPYYSTGTKSLAEIANLQGQNGRQQQQEAFNRFTVSPDYQFRFGEGQKALQNTAAAKGSLYSGNTAKALTDYGQGMASQEYGNYYNRLNDTSRQGAQTAGTLANLSQNYFGNQADLLRTKGDAIASGKVAGANAYQSTLQNLGQYLTAPQYKGLF